VSGPALTLRRYAVPLRPPATTALGTPTRAGLLVALDTPGGLVGLGEAAPLPGAPGASLVTCWRTLAALGSSELARLLHAAAEGPAALHRPLHALSLPPAARHALELAVADVAAQEAGLPLAGWLRPEIRPRVAVHRLVETPEQARAAAAASVGVLKVKVARRSLDEDLAHITALRRAVGSHLPLRLDANGRWTLDEARRALDALRPMGLESVEQPLPPHDPGGARAARDLAALTELRRALGPGLPIALDEGVTTRAALDVALDAGVVDRVVVKPMVVGGILPALALLERAAEAGVPGYLTTTFETGVGRLGALHAAAAAPAGRLLACGLDTGLGLVADPAPTPAARAGSLKVPATPGLGASPEAARWVLGDAPRGRGGGGPVPQTWERAPC